MVIRECIMKKAAIVACSNARQMATYLAQLRQIEL